MSKPNKILLITKIDNEWNIIFIKNNKRLKLCWDKRKDWLWIEQIAKELWKENFMKDFFEICEVASERNKALFTLLELPEVLFWKFTTNNNETLWENIYSIQRN